jgi:hypothetical protein
MDLTDDGHNKEVAFRSDVRDAGEARSLHVGPILQERSQCFQGGTGSKKK